MQGPRSENRIVVLVWGKKDQMETETMSQSQGPIQKYRKVYKWTWYNNNVFNIYIIMLIL